MIMESHGDGFSLLEWFCSILSSFNNISPHLSPISFLSCLLPSTWVQITLFSSLLSFLKHLLCAWTLAANSTLAVIALSIQAIKRICDSQYGKTSVTWRRLNYLRTDESRQCDLAFMKHHVLDWCNVPNQIIKWHGRDLMGLTGCSCLRCVNAYGLKLDVLYEAIN